MLPAPRVYSSEFDHCFFRLPAGERRKIEAKIALVGAQLRLFHHERLRGVSFFKLRVGDYRVVYTFDVEANRLDLITLGNRKDVYRGLSR